MKFTYLVINNVTGMFYYGAKYSEGCHPDDLWSNYFTSSKSVHADITKYGENSFSFQVRRVFELSEECLKWEYKVLRRIKAKDRSDCYNLTNGGGDFNSSKRMKISNPMFNKEALAKSVYSKNQLWKSGLHKSTANRPDIVTKTKNRMRSENPMRNKESIQKMLDSKRGNDGCTGTKWMANPKLQIRKRVSVLDVERMVKEGWILLSNRAPIPTKLPT